MRLVTKYLEMRSPSELRKTTRSGDQGFQVREYMTPNGRFNRDMYFRVGEIWQWIDKRPWTEKQWQAYAELPNLRTFAGYFQDVIVGYYELRRCAPSATKDRRSEITDQMDEEGVEIAYFGLLPEFIGRGFGGALLTSAIENAWDWAPTPTRVWVHTCNRDHPRALANYQARGFQIYKEEVEDLPSVAGTEGREAIKSRND